MPQSLANVTIHLVFSTKDRAPVLGAAIRPNLHAYLATVVRNAGCECPRGATDLGRRLLGRRCACPRLVWGRAVGPARTPSPPLDVQRRIVAELDAESAEIEAVRRLIPRFEAKIQRVMDRVWGKAPGREVDSP